jgi:hypothetical protein
MHTACSGAVGPHSSAVSFFAPLAALLQPALTIPFFINLSSVEIRSNTPPHWPHPHPQLILSFLFPFILFYFFFDWDYIAYSAHCIN